MKEVKSQRSKCKFLIFSLLTTAILLLTFDFFHPSSLIPHPSSFSLNSFLIFAENSAQAIGDFTQCRVNLDRGNNFRNEILPRLRDSFDLRERVDHCSLISFAATLSQALNLLRLKGGIDLAGLLHRLFVHMKSINSDDDLPLSFDSFLILIGGSFELALDESGFDRGEHPTEVIDLL